MKAIHEGMITCASKKQTQQLLDDVIVIEPGKAHTFLSNSPDYFHFAIHTPALQGEAAKADKVPVSHARLGL